jgi:predicted dehydrogenase
LSIAFAWSQKLRTLAAKKKAVFQYGTQQRGDQAQFRRACELVRNGYIGDVREVFAWCPDMSQQFENASVPPYGSTVEIAPPEGFDFDRWIGPAPMRPYTADRCTNFGGYHIYDYALGFIAGWGAHPLDIAQWGLDRDHTGPVRVEGKGQLPPAGSLWDTIESYDVSYEYADGVQVRLMSDRLAPGIFKDPRGFNRDHGTMFRGSKGWVIVDRSGLYASDRALLTHEVGENEVRLMRTTSQARNFADCIRSRATTISPLESAIRSDTLSHLGDIAIRKGRALKWDPAAEKIVGDEEAARMLDRPLRAKWDLFAENT